jgi:hypothetical protein
MAVKPQLAKLPNITPKIVYFSKLELPFLMDLAPMKSKKGKKLRPIRYSDFSR